MTTTLEPTIEQGVQTWQIDASHTNVEFAIKHLMISTVKGRFADVTGALKGDFADPSEFELDVTIDTASIDTRQAQRDGHLRSPDFFDADKWPTIRFVGKRVQGDVNGEFSLFGDLTIRDVTREVKLSVTNEGSVTDPWGNPRVGFSAKTKIDRTDFGLLYNQALEAGGVLLGDEIRISLDVELTEVREESSA
ncbi:MAG: YceI family protein [Gemmatimonadales bacterium]